MPGRAEALYPRLLGAAWHELAEPVRRLHFAEGRVRGTGRFTVRRGKGRLARILWWLLRLPVPGEAVPIRLEVTAGPDGETWDRVFGDTHVMTRQTECSGLLAERFRSVELRFRLSVNGHALGFEQVAAALCLGPLRVPLPRPLAPQVQGSAWADADPGLMRVAVRIDFPPGKLLLAYEGFVGSEGATP